MQAVDDKQYTADLKALEILLAMEPLNPSRKSRKLQNVDDGDGPTLPQPPSQGKYGNKYNS